LGWNPCNYMVLQAVTEFPVFHPIGGWKIGNSNPPTIRAGYKQINIVGSNYSEKTERKRMMFHSQHRITV